MFVSSVKLCCVVTKIGTRICLYTPYQRTKFQQDQSTHFRVRADFVICAKRRRKKTSKKKTKNKNWNFGLLYLGKAGRDLLQFCNPASPYRPYRRAVPQQIWWSSGKRSRIYECVKIATLLFLLIYSLPFLRALITPISACPGLLGPHDTLLCVLMLM